MIKPFKKPTKEEPKTQVVEIKGVQILTIKGDKGDKPTKDELLELIEPLIPEPLPGVPGEPGEKGKDYILTENDKKEIAGKVKVPVVEKVIEKTEVIKEKNIPLRDTPEETRDKLESLIKGKKLTIHAIEDLPELLKELSKIISNSKQPLGLLKGSIHGRSTQVRFKDDITPSGTINGVNTDFTLPNLPITGSLKVYRGGARQRVTEDYTLVGKVITFIIAPQVGEVILTDYRY